MVQLDVYDLLALFNSYVTSKLHVVRNSQRFGTLLREHIIGNELPELQRVRIYPIQIFLRFCR